MAHAGCVPAPVASSLLAEPSDCLALAHHKGISSSDPLFHTSHDAHVDRVHECL